MRMDCSLSFAIAGAPTRAAVLLAAVFWLLASSAGAQTPKGDLGEPEPEENRNSWQLDCSETEGFSTGACRIMQTIVIKVTKQPLLTAAVERRPAGQGYALVFKAPHGLLLTPGLALETDGIERMVLHYRLSDATGVFATTAISAELLDALKKNETLKVSVVTAAGQQVGIPVTLQGFEEALGQLEATP